MRVQVRHDMDHDALIKSLVAFATAEGIAPDLADALEKSRRDYEHRLPTEAHLREMADGLEARYSEVIEQLGENLQRWFNARFPSPKPWMIRKATPNMQLTGPEVTELKDLIEAHFQPQGMTFRTDVQWSVPPEQWHRWQSEGIVVRGLPMPEIADAYVAGRLYQVIQEGHSYAEMRSLARQVPLTRAGQIAIRHAEEHAAHYITKFGQRLANYAADQSLTVNQRIGRALITRYIQGDLKTTRPTPDHNLTVEERGALESEHAVDDWRGLARELYKTFKGSDSQRDWMRVAVSETRVAYNTGRFGALEEEGVQQVYYLVRDTACPYCTKLYLHSDGTPKLFDMKEIMRNISAGGGMNVGRKASEIGKRDGWLPTALAHPWCRCIPVPYTGHAFLARS